MKIPVLFIIFFFLATFSFGVWEELGPGGGYTRSVVVSPLDENVMYATSYTVPARIARSTDAGNTWNIVSTHDMINYCLAIDPTDDDIVYSGANTIVYKTTDAGTTWNGSSVPSVGVKDIVVHATDQSIIYATGSDYIEPMWYGAFCKSTDGGATWTTTQLNPNQGGGTSIIMDPNDPEVIYVGGNYRQGVQTYPLILKSTDGGANFTNVAAGQLGTSRYVLDLCNHPLNSDILYASTELGLYRSVDAGSTWTETATYGYRYAMGTSSADPTLIYAAGRDSLVYISTDTGATWSMAGSMRGVAVFHIAVSPSQASTVYLGNNMSLYCSTNSGTDWFPAHDGLYMTLINDFSVAPSMPTTIYIEQFNVGVCKSTNSGDDWTLLPSFLSCGNLCAVRAHNTNPDIVYALEGTG